MNCSCQKEKVKPTQFCINCVHKHLSTALALSEFIKEEKKAIDYKVAAQINLAVLHLLDKHNIYQKEIDFCRSLEYDILMKNEFINDLEFITSYFWNIMHDRKQSKDEIVCNDIKTIDERSIEFALLKISIAIELMNYEPSYESVNYSTAIGQLSIASCILSNIDKNISEQCRSICHDIENSSADSHILENFRIQVLNKYI